MTDKSIAEKEIIQALNWRYATKVFDTSKKIAEKDWKTLENALQLAPSSYGLQPWRFIVVQNSELRKKLRAVAWNQSQITDASHLVVFATREKIDEAFVQSYIDKIAEIRGVPKDSLDGFKGAMVGDVVNGPRASSAKTWTQRQAYIAIGFLLETAALLHIDACPMEGFSAAEFDKLLKLEGTGWGSVAVVTLGYRSEKDQLAKAKKVRFEKSQIIQVID